MPADQPVARPLMQAGSDQYDALARLGAGDGQIWNPILSGAGAGALALGGGTWLFDKLRAKKTEDPEEQQAAARRRLMWSLLAGTAGGYLGGSAAWKYKVNPLLGQGLAKSVFMPERAFADGMQKNWSANLQAGAQRLKGVPWREGKYHNALEKVDSLLEDVTKPIDMPVMREFNPHGLFRFIRPFIQSPGDNEALLARRGVVPPAPTTATPMRQLYNMMGAGKAHAALPGAATDGQRQILEQRLHQHVSRLGDLNPAETQPTTQT